MIMVSCPSCGNKVKIREIKNEKSQWIYRRSKWSNTRANPTREDSRRFKCQRGPSIMVGCGLRFSDKENSSKEYEVFSLCGISLRNSKICLCDKCEKKLDALHEKPEVQEWKG